MSPLGKWRSLGLGLLLALDGAVAAPLLGSDFGSGGEEAVAFVTQGGREVVTMGVAGKDLNRARLIGAAAPVAGTVVDPVSRLVVFQAQGSLGSGFQLLVQAPFGGVLKDPSGNVVYRIRDRVKQVGGRYLPFTLLRLTAPGAPPKVGTPLLDTSGRVAAVAHQSAGDRMFYALPVEVVRRVLDDSRDGQVSKSWLGLVLTPKGGTARVERVVEGSPADVAGVRAGDVLLEMGGRRLADYGDAVNAFYLLRPDQRVRVRIRRGSGEVVLELTPVAAAS